MRSIVAAIVLVCAAVSPVAAEPMMPEYICASVFHPGKSDSCSVRLPAGDHEIELDLVASSSGRFVLEAAFSNGDVFYHAECTFEPSEGICSGWASYDGGRGGS